MEETIDRKQIQDAIQAAKEEGRFQGEVMAGLMAIQTTLEKIDKHNIIQAEKIDGKVDKQDFDSLSKRVEHLQKVAYMGMGGLAVIQLIISLIK